jgi:hypothetical protein
MVIAYLIIWGYHTSATWNSHARYIPHWSHSLIEHVTDLMVHTQPTLQGRLSAQNTTHSTDFLQCSSHIYSLSKWYDKAWRASNSAHTATRDIVWVVLEHHSGKSRGIPFQACWMAWYTCVLHAILHALGPASCMPVIEKCLPHYLTSKGIFQ